MKFLENVLLIVHDSLFFDASFVHRTNGGMTLEKKLKLPPVPTPLPLVALFVPILLGIVPPKALAESQGVILYFSTERYTFLKKVLSYHNGDTMCRTKNRIPRCKPFSSSPNFQLLQLNGLARTPATEHA